MSPQLRREIKHVAQGRQLLARIFALWCATYSLYGAPPAPPPEAPANELQAARLMAAALIARQAKPADLQKLDRIFTDLETKNPGNAEIRNGHAEYLWNIGNRERAMDLWLAAEKLDPANASVLDHLGDAFFAAGTVKKAADYYGRAVALAPANAAYRFGYANVLFLFRHDLHDAAHPGSDAVMDEALGHFAEAARLEPLNAEYARGFAETFYSVGKPDWNAALQAWRHFYEISAKKDFALLNLARVQMKLGQKVEARACMAEIQDPQYDRLKKRLKERIESE